MKHIFLSDVHLGAFTNEQNQQLENELIRLIDFCESNKIQIHILGDFFDYWMEFPEFIPELGRTLLDRFERYNRYMGQKTTYITGNHDYWTVSHFEERGFNVEHEYVDLQLDDKTVLLCHGDGFADKQFELPRPFLHRVLRNETFVTLYKMLLSGKTGLQLMKSFSKITRDENYLNTERLSSWAKSMLKKFQYDVIISGHDHVPRIETFTSGSYINTGAFHKHKTVLKYTKGAFKIVTWCDGTNEFKPFQNHQCNKPVLNG